MLKFTPRFSPSGETKTEHERVVPSAVVDQCEVERWAFRYVNTYNNRIFWPK